MDHELLEPPLCVSNNLHRAARTVTRIYADEMAPFGLQRSQFGVLTMLALSGEATLQDVADRLDMDKTTVSRTIKPLLVRGLVATRPNANDGRSKLMNLTEAGTALYEEAVVGWRRAQRRVVGAFGETRWRALFGELEALRETVQAE